MEQQKTLESFSRINTRSQQSGEGKILLIESKRNIDYRGMLKAIQSEKV